MADLDHRFMVPPYLRVVDRFPTPGGHEVTKWDLRVAQPNASQVAMPTVHSVEHFLGSFFLRRPLVGGRGVVNVAPMGCQTGFYIVAIGVGGFADMSALVAEALTEIGDATEVPLADEVRCGWAENHSLEGAKQLAGMLLRRRAEWSEVGPDAREVSD